MEPGGGSSNQDERGERTPPDEQQMRFGRSRVARGFDGSAADDSSFGQGAASFGQGAAAFGQGAASGRSPSEQGDGASFGLGRVSGSGAQGDAGDGLRRGGWAEAQAGTGPLRCHFLRSVGADGRLADPQKTAVPTHRCAAYGDPLPLSLRQQELVCLQRVHVSCPRYVRGTLLANESQTEPEKTEDRAGGVPIVMIAGICLVVAAVAVLLGSFLGVGPLASSSAAPGTVAQATASATASATDTPQITVEPSATATPVATPTSTPVATATATATATVKPTATARPTATPRASATWPPGATASRMNLLVPCTGQSNCYVYTVRGAGPAPSGNGSKVGDTLAGIEWFFGVTDAKVRALNPGMRVPIRPGDKIKIPTPTRWNS